jgi:two-component system, LuxR family, sensor histidine kinase TtrS
VNSCRRAVRNSGIIILLAVWSAGVAVAGEIRIGVLAWLDSEETEAQWAPFLHGLEQGMPGSTIAFRHFDLSGIAAALEAGEVDFVITNPGHYVMLEEAGITRIATQVSAVQRDPAHVVGSTVIVRSNRQDLRSLADLRGKKLAAVSPDAFGGYQVALGELQHHGLNLDRGDIEPTFTGFPMTTVVDVVLQDGADAGVIRTCLLEQLEREHRIEPGSLRVLSPQANTAHACRSTSPLYPGWAFAAASGTAPDLSREVLLALLSMPTDAAGLRWTVPADYRPVHELFRRLQIGPYAFMRETGWRSLIVQSWPWVAGLIAALLLWGAYTLHVEHLVKRRTRELSAVLTERQNLEERVRSGQQQMEHLSRLSILGELAGTLAHELNHPLAAISNYARSLIRRQERGALSDAALHQAAEEIASESERAAGIIAGIRSFARKRNQAREARSIADLVHEADALMHGMLAKAPSITLHDRLPANAGQVTVDPLQLQQVLLNLLKNAWDAQQAAGNDEPITVELQLADDRCLVTIRDHGTGLTPQLQEHLFEPFFTTKPEGLGLGLSICKTIVEAHGGELQAEAPPQGDGLLFRFTLPLSNPTARRTSHDAS